MFTDYFAGDPAIQYPLLWNYWTFVWSCLDMGCTLSGRDHGLDLRQKISTSVVLVYKRILAYMSMFISDPFYTRLTRDDDKMALT